MSKHIDITLGAEKLEQEIEKVKPAENSRDFKKYLARKAFSIGIRAKNISSNGSIEYNPELLGRAIAFIEPIRVSREAICIYIDNLVTLGKSFSQSDNFEEAIRRFEKAIATFEEFKAAGYDVSKHGMSPHELFGVKKELDMHLNLIRAWSEANMSIYGTFKYLKNTKMQIKYAVPNIIGHIKIHVISMYECKKTFRLFLNGVLPEVQMDLDWSNLVPEITGSLKILIEGQRFAQIEHILSSLMLKLDGELDAGQEQSVIDQQKAILSYMFALWGLKIIKYSLEALEDPKFVENNPICHDVQLIEELKVKSGNRYAKQFPTNVIKEKGNLADFLKKAKNWELKGRKMSRPSECICFAELKALTDYIEKKLHKN